MISRFAVLLTLTKPLLTPAPRPHTFEDALKEFDDFLVSHNVGFELSNLLDGKNQTTVPPTGPPGGHATTTSPAPTVGEGLFQVLGKDVGLIILAVVIVLTVLAGWLYRHKIRQFVFKTRGDRIVTIKLAEGPTRGMTNNQDAKNGCSFRLVIPADTPWNEMRRLLRAKLGIPEVDRKSGQENMIKVFCSRRDSENRISDERSLVDNELEIQQGDSLEIEFVPASEKRSDEGGGGQPATVSHVDESTTMRERSPDNDLDDDYEEEIADSSAERTGYICLRMLCIILVPAGLLWFSSASILGVLCLMTDMANATKLSGANCHPDDLKCLAAQEALLFSLVIPLVISLISSSIRGLATDGEEICLAVSRMRLQADEFRTYAENLGAERKRKKEKLQARSDEERRIESQISELQACTDRLKSSVSDDPKAEELVKVLEERLDKEKKEMQSLKEQLQSVGIQKAKPADSLRDRVEAQNQDLQKADYQKKIAEIAVRENSTKDLLNMIKAHAKENPNTSRASVAQELWQKQTVCRQQKDDAQRKIRELGDSEANEDRIFRVNIDRANHLKERAKYEEARSSFFRGHVPQKMFHLTFESALQAIAVYMILFRGIPRLLLSQQGVLGAAAPLVAVGLPVAVQRFFHKGSGRRWDCMFSLTTIIILVFIFLVAPFSGGSPMHKLSVPPECAAALLLGIPWVFNTIIFARKTPGGMLANMDFLDGGTSNVPLGGSLVLGASNLGHSAFAAGSFGESHTQLQLAQLQHNSHSPQLSGVQQYRMDTQIDMGNSATSAVNGVSNGPLNTSPAPDPTTDKKRWEYLEVMLQHFRHTAQAIRSFVFLGLLLCLYFFAPWTQGTNLGAVFSADDPTYLDMMIYEVVCVFVCYSLAMLGVYIRVYFASVLLFAPGIPILLLMVGGEFGKQLCGLLFFPVSFQDYADTDDLCKAFIDGTAAAPEIMFMQAIVAALLWLGFLGVARCSLTLPEGAQPPAAKEVWYRPSDPLFLGPLFGPISILMNRIPLGMKQNQAAAKALLSILKMRRFLVHHQKDKARVELDEFLSHVKMIPGKKTLSQNFLLLTSATTPVITPGVQPSRDDPNPAALEALARQVQTTNESTAATKGWSWPTAIWFAGTQQSTYGPRRSQLDGLRILIAAMIEGAEGPPLKCIQPLLGESAVGAGSSGLGNSNLAQTQQFHSACDDSSGQVPASGFLRNKNNQNEEKKIFELQEQIRTRVMDTKTSYRIITCTTMWHEEEQEMYNLVSTLRRIDEFVVGQHRANPHDAKDNYSSMIIMDNVFDMQVPVDQSDPDYDFGAAVQKKKSVSNVYADRLFRVIGKVWNAKVKEELIKSAVRTDYGVICKVQISPTGIQEMSVIFKDRSLVKAGKRWSQILYMGLINFYVKENAKKNSDDWNPHTTFVMMTDGDTTFTGRSLNFLVSGLKKDPTCAGVCGRIAPKGKSNGPIVMYEKFEYAAGHWFQKVAEHVMGSVLCCPGCFSCYRLEALNSVVCKYSDVAHNAMEYLQMDMGEDRWMCTLLIRKGRVLKYEANAIAETFAPEEFGAFFDQRRRWVASTMCNLYMLLCVVFRIQSKYRNMNVIFIFYIAMMFISAVLAPATVVLLTIIAFQFGLRMDAGWSLILAVAMPGSLCMLSVYHNTPFFKGTPAKKREREIGLATVISILYLGVVIAMIIGEATSLIVPETNSNNGQQCPTINPGNVYLGCLAAMFIIAAILHRRDVLLLPYGIVYLLSLPAMYLVLMIYVCANMDVMSWGTRAEVVVEDYQEQWLDVRKLPKRGGDEVKLSKWLRKNIVPLFNPAAVGTGEGKIKIDSVIPAYALCQPVRPPSDPNFVKRDLQELRTYTALQVFGLNILWFLLIELLQSGHAELQSLCQNVAGLFFLAIFSIIMVMQFVSLVYHRMESIITQLAHTKLSSPQQHGDPLDDSHQQLCDGESTPNLGRDRIGSNSGPSPRVHSGTLSMDRSQPSRNPRV